MERYGVRESFQVAIDGGKRDEAVRTLCDVGADEVTAWEIVAVLIPVEGSAPPARE
jgi:hypothetical protein